MATTGKQQTLSELLNTTCNEYEKYVVTTTTEFVDKTQRYKNTIAMLKTAIHMGFTTMEEYQNYEHLRQQKNEFEKLESERMYKLYCQRAQQKKILALLKPAYDTARQLVGDCEEPTFKQVMDYYEEGFTTYDETMTDIQHLFARAESALFTE